MRYLSFFSGIGGFELALQRTFGAEAQCAGFSEIDRRATEIYLRHYPDHEALGDITALTQQQLKRVYDRHGGIDLVVGGFPCKDMSVVNSKRIGLEGSKSRLFFTLLAHTKAISEWNAKQNKPTYFMFENVGHIIKYRNHVTTELQAVFGDAVQATPIDGGQFSAQRRKRWLWTNFPVPPVPEDQDGAALQDVLLPREATRKGMDDVQFSVRFLAYMNRLRKRGGNSTQRDHMHAVVVREEADGTRICTFQPSPEGIVQGYGTRWVQYSVTDSNDAKSKTIMSTSRQFLIDRRFGKANEFVVRRFYPAEMEELFGYPAGYTATNNQGQAMGKTVRYRVLGLSLVVGGVKYVADALKQHATPLLK